MEFSTRAIHVGQSPDTAAMATVPPLYLTSTYTYEELGVTRGYDYGRHGNPTRAALEECLASLEGGKHALSFASGMAAVDACFRLLRPGDHLLLAEDIYGGTYRLVEDVFRHAGIEVSYGEAGSPEQFATAFRPNTKLVWIETPTNPLLRLVDICAISELAHRAGALLAVDGTFATPYFQRPLSLGADIVMHSTTKYLGGHSDLLGGALVVNDGGLRDRLYLLSRVAGATPSPFDCWLTLRGVKTLAVRMRQHAANAVALAEHLSEHPKIIAVHYPGLPSHPQHALACKQMSGFGGMMAAEVRGGRDAAVRVLNAVQVFTLTGSLGGVESILSYPREMSHAMFTADKRAERGITDGVLRFSVGIEDASDLIADIDQALELA